MSEANPELMRVEAEYRLAAYSFDEACKELKKFLDSHLGITAPLIKRDRTILARVNELRDRDPRLCQLESRQRQTLQTRNRLLAERARLLQACGHIR